jgi:serine O-acetyltransferase
MFENISGDFEAARQETHEPAWWQKYHWAKNLRVLMHLGMSAVIAYRFGHWARRVRIPVLRQLLMLIAVFLRRWVGWFTGIYVDPKADIGPGLVIHTGYGIQIGATTIGKNCTVQTGVVIAGGVRSIGDNVWFGAGAKVIGDTKIGDNVVVMPNSLVLMDVAPNTTIVGVPARIKLRGGRPQKFAPGYVTRKNGAGAGQPAGKPEPSLKR